MCQNSSPSSLESTNSEPSPAEVALLGPGGALVAVLLEVTLGGVVAWVFRAMTIRVAERLSEKVTSQHLEPSMS